MTLVELSTIKDWLMAITEKLQHAAVGDFYLDPRNPRLGRGFTSGKPTQADVLEKILDSWAVEELATSFLENGYWPQEALIVAEEEWDGEKRKVVLEGNRRLAALKLLHEAFAQEGSGGRWSKLISGYSYKDVPAEIPYIAVESRKDVMAYLGFRHVSGISPWKPAEKAQYIVQLIDEQNLSYQEVAHKIGSRTSTVRQNYISYRVLLQMEEIDDIDVDEVKNKFSVLYLSLRAGGAQRFLGIDMKAEPEAARLPIPDDRRENMVRFSRWVFGDKKTPPLFTDSRNLDKFANILSNEKAVEYLTTVDNPQFTVAFEIGGGDKEEVRKTIAKATAQVQMALMSAHRFKEDDDIEKAVRAFSKDAMQLIGVFKTVSDDIHDEIGQKALANFIKKMSRGE